MAPQPKDRIPTSNIVTESLTGFVIITKAVSLTGEIDFGVIRRDVGYFSGRILITGLEAAAMALSVGWGCDSFPRTLPLYVDTVKADYDPGVYVAFKALDTSDIDNAQEYIFFLVNPADPKAIPLIPEGESLKLYLTIANLGAASIRIDAELDYEAGSDFSVVQVENITTP